MILQNKTKLGELLEEQYSGRVVEIPQGYAHATVLTAMRDALSAKTMVVRTPLYYGEAEELILVLLKQALISAQRSPGEVVKIAMKQAGAYSLISAVTRISQAKEIANVITANAFNENPLVDQLSKAAQELALTSKQDAGNSLNRDYRTQYTNAWNNLSALLNAFVPAEHERRLPTGDITQDILESTNVQVVDGVPRRVSKTPIQIMYEASVAGLGLVSQNTVGVFDNFLQNMRRGKGNPLSQENQQKLLALRATVEQLVDQLINKALASGEEDATFADAYTAMLWYLSYLKISEPEQYDVTFPQGDVMTNSQAWVQTIKTSSLKLAKFFYDISISAMSFDISYARRMWEATRKFYGVVLNSPLSDISDMDRLWDECTDAMGKLLNPIALPQVDEILKRLTDYVEATQLLPKDAFDIVDSSLSSVELSDAVTPTKHGGEILSSLDVLSQRRVDNLDRSSALTTLASRAGAFELALQYIARLRDVVSSVGEMAIASPLVDISEFSALPWPNEGSIDQWHPSDFHRHSPFYLSYDKWDYVEGKSFQWVLEQYLMVPFYRTPLMQSLSAQKSPVSKIIWPEAMQVPGGDVITAGYALQPIPAEYTNTRSRDRVDYTMEVYLKLLGSHTGITVDPSTYFLDLARIINKFPGTYKLPLLDQLAAVMFVYSYPEGEPDKITWEQPGISTVYGVPLAAFQKQNAITKSLSKQDQHIFMRNVTVNNTTYVFFLHRFYPKPTAVKRVPYYIVKGAWVSLPILMDIWSEHGADVDDAEGRSVNAWANILRDGGDRAISALHDVIRNVSSTKAVKWLPARGFYSGLLTMPHILFDWTDYSLALNSIDGTTTSSFGRYARISVKTKYDDVERQMHISVWDSNPIEIMDRSDYDAAVGVEDPSPISEMSHDAPTPTPDDKRAPDTAPSAEPQKPTTMGAPTKQVTEEERRIPGTGVVVKESIMKGDAAAELEKIAGITKAPVLTVEGDQTKIMSGTAAPQDKVTTSPIEPTPGSGDPTGTKSDGKGTTPESQAILKYWKKVADDGTVEDVVQSDKCPTGYVPATVEDFTKFKNAEKPDQE
jgi:hypothetical protein